MDKKLYERPSMTIVEIEGDGTTLTSLSVTTNNGEVINNTGSNEDWGADVVESNDIWSSNQNN